MLCNVSKRHNDRIEGVRIVHYDYGVSNLYLGSSCSSSRVLTEGLDEICNSSPASKY